METGAVPGTKKSRAAGGTTTISRLMSRKNYGSKAVGTITFPTRPTIRTCATTSTGFLVILGLMVVCFTRAG